MAFHHHPTLPARALLARILLAVCVFSSGFGSQGICVEPDGRTHVAGPDHACCDPMVADTDCGPGDALVDDSPDSVHECAHTPPVQPVSGRGSPDAGRFAMARLEGVLLRPSDLAGIAAGARVGGLLGELPVSARIQTVLLRL